MNYGEGSNQTATELKDIGKRLTSLEASKSGVEVTGEYFHRFVSQENGDDKNDGKQPWRCKKALRAGLDSMP